MLTLDVRFEGWTAADWVRLLSLFRAGRAPEPAPTGTPGGILAIYEAGRLRKLLHTRAGRLDPHNHPWPLAPPELARRHGAAWALLLRAGALDTLMERFGARSRQGDDVLLQALVLTQIVRELIGEGAIEVWPPRAFLPPLATHSVVARTMRTLCPAGKAVALGLFEGGELWTAVVLRRREEGIDLVLGPDDLRPAMGLLAGDWRRDYRHLVDSIEASAGPLATGVFAERETFVALAAERSPGAWARAVAVRDVVVAPLGGALALPLGVDAAYGLAEALRSLVGRFRREGAAEAREAADGRQGLAASGVETVGALPFLVRLLMRNPKTPG
ncbi:MAG TPA: hypothetical protein VFS43_31100 [Polyangiaceae bacterium]|nr:hypothetical protein [Polyangiaceae bacterium]